MICTQKEIQQRAVIDPKAPWQFTASTGHREASYQGRYWISAEFMNVHTRERVNVTYWLPDSDEGYGYAHIAICQIVNSGRHPSEFAGAELPLPDMPYKRDILWQCLASTEDICHDRRCLEGVCEKHAVMCEDCGELFHVGCTEIFDGVHLCRECLSVASPYVSSPRMGRTRVA